MKRYPLIQSTLEGIFGAQVGNDEEASNIALRRDLNHPLFKEGIQKELLQALADESLSWQQLLEACDVDYFSTEDEARNFVIENVFQVVFPEK